jgi:hypothetical protein
MAKCFQPRHDLKPTKRPYLNQNCNFINVNNFVFRPIAYQEINSTMILEHSPSIQKLSQTTALLEKRKRE